MNAPRQLACSLCLLLPLMSWAAKPQIAGGEQHTLALKSDGTVYAWGGNADGQLGDGSTASRLTPVAVSGLSDVVTIAAGKSHSLAVKADGTVWAWGNNGLNQLGDGTSTSRSAPKQVNGLSGVIAVSAGDFFSMALKADGTVWSWGDNGNGQLGDGSKNQRSTPVQIKTLSGISAISAGYYYATALKSDGTVWSWGINDNAQLGDGTTTERAEPKQVAGVSDGVAIAAAFGHVAVIRRDGSLLAWGRNNHGQLADGKALYIPPETIEYRPSIAPMQGFTNSAAVAAGLYHTLVLDSSGAIQGVGGNIHGQLGNGASQPEDRPTAVAITALSQVGAIGIGRFQSFAIKTDGGVYGFGKNDAGQMGDGASANHASPTPVVGVGGTGTLDLGLFCAKGCATLAVAGSRTKKAGDMLDVRLALNGLASQSSLAGKNVDLYVAVQLTDGSLLFMKSPQLFGAPAFDTNVIPYQSNLATTDREGTLISAFPLPALPKGTYRLLTTVVATGNSPLNSANWVGGLSMGEFEVQ